MPVALSEPVALSDVRIGRDAERIQKLGFPAWGTQLIRYLALGGALFLGAEDCR